MSEPKFDKGQCEGLKTDLTAYLQTLKVPVLYCTIISQTSYRPADCQAMQSITPNQAGNGIAPMQQGYVRLVKPAYPEAPSVKTLALRSQQLPTTLLLLLCGEQNKLTGRAMS